MIMILLLFGDVGAKQLRRENTPVIWKTLEPLDNRIRILWIDQDYVPFVNAGSEVCSHQLNKYLMKQPYKYDIWVASPGCPQRTYEGIRCFDLYDSVLLGKVFEHTNILQSHSGAYRNQMMWLCRTTGIPFVAWVHTLNYARDVKGSWDDPRCAGRQWTAFNSNSLRNIRKDADPNYINIFFPPVDYREYAISRNPMYVTLSNVNENKGGHLLIELAKALPDIEFQGVLGGYRKQITQKGLPNLHYVPHTPDIKAVYANTWIQIMPSKEETWGRTAVEAMSSGIPLIVSPTPGLQECCENAAIYCDRNNLQEWISILRRFQTDKEFYNKRSALALERSRSLDPRPDLKRCEEWLVNKVVPSKIQTNRQLSYFEKNMLFR